jgi:hypothetical protein
MLTTRIKIRNYLMVQITHSVICSFASLADALGVYIAETCSLGICVNYGGWLCKLRRTGDWASDCVGRDFLVLIL